MPLVGIALFPTLSSLSQDQDLLAMHCGLEYYLSTLHDPLTDLTPTDWGPTLPPIKHLEGRSVYAGVVTILIGKLCQIK